MHLTRKEFLAMAAAAPLAAESPRSRMGIATTCYMTVRRFRDTLEFMDHCHSLGAGGVQTALTAQTPEYLRQVKERAAKYGMWIEVMGGLPRSDNDESFQRTAASAKEVGAICIRSACLGGRRYETFAAMEDWKKFVANSKAAIARGVAMAEKAKMPWALENHKDWTVDEFLEILKQYSSPYLGVCLDTGNNISLLDDAMDVVERLAPYAISTHIKDMGLDEYADGFLLSEVPLGDGYLDIAQIIRIIQRARPQTRMTLEMITRDPLKIPVLTDKYWATFTDRDGARLARALRTARTAKNKKPLPMLTTLAAKAQAEAEEENVKKCLTYARERLSL